MVLKNFKGKFIDKNYSRYLIDWDGSSLSKFQFEVKQFFKPYWIGCQVYEEFPVLGTRYKIDIYNSNYKLAIEVDGEQHYKFNKHFHGNRANFLASIYRDEKKFIFCEINEIRVVQILPEDLKLLTPKYVEEKFDITLT